MQRYNLTNKLFDFEEDSESSANSVIYISSDSEDEVSSSWDSDWSTDTEAIIDRIEREVKAAPIPIAGRVMTAEDSSDEMVAGTSNTQPILPSPPNWDLSTSTRKCASRRPKGRRNRESNFALRYCLSWSLLCPLLITREDLLTPLWCR